MMLLIALAGGAGAVARFAIDTWISRRLRTSLPLGTFIINVTGSFGLGLLVGWCARHGDPGGVASIFGTGFLGGYTTFSAASVEAVRLAKAGRRAAAVVHAGGMLAASVAAAALGLWMAG